MKILYSNRTLYPFEGGADISALTLLEHLSKKHDVSAVYIGKKLENSKIKCYVQDIKQIKGVWANIFLLNIQFYNILKKIVEEEKPDLIISQDYLIPVSVKIAKKFDIKSIVFLRNYFHLSIDGFRSHLPDEEKFGRSNDFVYQVQYPLYVYMVRKFQWALKNTTLVCSVSRYVKDVTFKYLGVKSEVIRPFVFTDVYDVDVKGDYIGYINPDKHKGLEIFEKIADQIPEKKFLVVGKKEYEPKSKNVESLGWIDNKKMKEVYEKTRLVLIPSIWPDPCPRIGIETMPAGIPIVVSKRGGLVEEAEERGIVVNDIFNIDEWVEAIKKFDDIKFYNKMSKNSRLKYIDFAADRQFTRFDALIKNIFL